MTPMRIVLVSAADAAATTPKAAKTCSADANRLEIVLDMEAGPFSLRMFSAVRLSESSKTILAAHGGGRTQRFSPSMSAILQVSHVTKSFGGLKAVDDVSFEVEPGKIIVIIGPNGAGKTTLFDLISGFMAPDDGEVAFEGASLAGRPPPHIARLGLVRSFQIMQVFPDMSVRDVVTAAALLRLPMNAAVEWADDVLADVGLA